ncbi:MAG: hypothetical protein WCD69_24160 [Xanthobacteraceae bacterium]
MPRDDGCRGSALKRVQEGRDNTAMRHASYDFIGSVMPIIRPGTDKMHRGLLAAVIPAQRHVKIDTNKLELKDRPRCPGRDFQLVSQWQQKVI